MCPYFLGHPVYAIFKHSKNILPVNRFQKKLHIMFLVHCLIDGANSSLFLLLFSRFAYFFFPNLTRLTRWIAISVISRSFFIINFEWDGNFKFWWFHQKDLVQIYKNILYLKSENVFLSINNYFQVKNDKI